MNYIQTQRSLTLKKLRTELIEPTTLASHRIRFAGYFESFRAWISQSTEILDMGCRNGGFVSYLLEQGIRNVFGVELVLEALKYGPPYSLRVCGDAHKLSFRSESFGLAVMTHLIEHCDKPRVLIREAWRVLKPEGLIFIEIPLEIEPEQIPTEWGHYTPFSNEKDFFDLFDSGFSMLWYRVDPKKRKWLQYLGRKVL